MIDYSETEVGDVLRIVGVGAPGYAELGDLVRVTSTAKNSAMVEDRHGNPCEFVFNCGAARLEATEWKKDFPESETGSEERKRKDQEERANSPGRVATHEHEPASVRRRGH